MGQLKPLIILAAIANLLTAILIIYARNQLGENSLEYFLIWIPLVWLITIILAIIISIIKRKSIFNGPVFIWSFIVLFSCTPIPAYITYEILNPEPNTRRDGEDINTKNGKVYKTEFWETTATRHIIAEKRFVADSAQEVKLGDKAYKKDSMWVYFGENRDTVKVEYYKNGALISSKQY